MDVKTIAAEDVEPVVRAMGITGPSFQEFNTKNVTAFNASVVQPANVPVIDIA